MGVKVNYSGTCEGCITYQRTIGQIPTYEGDMITPTAQTAMDLMHKAHHSRNATMSRRDDFIRMMEQSKELSPHHDLIRMYYDLALPTLANKKVVPGLFNNTDDGYVLSRTKLLGITHGKCLCGCGWGLKTTKNGGKLFRQGHDNFFMSLFKQLERGEITILDSSIPDNVRVLMGILPTCNCCGRPILKGIRVSGVVGVGAGSGAGSGWMGEWCATGRCECRKRDEIRTGRIGGEG